MASGSPEGPQRDRWASLYRRFHRALVAHVVDLTGDQALAEDVVQEVFVSALAGLDPEPVQPSLPRLRALAAALVRRRQSEPVLPAGLALHLPDPTPYGLAPDELGQAVAVAFGRLSPDDRWALSLVYDEGWTPAQVAWVFQLEEQALVRLLARARRRLRDEFHRVRDGATAGLGWVGAVRRRAQGAVLRLQGERASLWPWVTLDRLEAMAGLVATSAVTLSLATALALTPGLHGTEPGPGDRLGLAGPAPRPRVEGVSWERPAMPAEGPQSRADPAPTRAVRITPGLRRQGYDTGTYRGEEYSLDPGSAEVEAAKPIPGAQPEVVAPPVRFDCPPPEQRFLLLAVGCPLLEASRG